MSYTKQTWATGDTVTASKLNHMEDGIEGAGGYDIVICCADRSFSSNPSDYSILSGTYADISNKIVNNLPITGIVYCSSDYLGVGSNNLYDVVYLVEVFWDDYEGYIQISFRYISASFSGTTINDLIGKNLTIRIDDADTITNVVYEYGHKNL